MTCFISKRLKCINFLGVQMKNIDEGIDFICGDFLIFGATLILGSFSFLVLSSIFWMSLFFGCLHFFSCLHFVYLILGSSSFFGPVHFGVAFISESFIIFGIIFFWVVFKPLIFCHTQKVTAPNNGIESRWKSVGDIKCSLATSYNVVLYLGSGCGSFMRTMLPFFWQTRCGSYINDF